MNNVKKITTAAVINLLISKEGRSIHRTDVQQRLLKRLGNEAKAAEIRKQDLKLCEAISRAGARIYGARWVKEQIEFLGFDCYKEEVNEYYRNNKRNK